MKEVIFEDKKQTIFIDDIKRFESQMSINLPEEYLKHLLINNGGYPEKDTFPLIEPIWNDFKRGGTAVSGWFLAIHNDDLSNISKAIELMENRIPKNLIPIATTPGGDYICLCIKGSNYGKVYYWDHNWEAEDGEEPTFDNIYLIAHNFKDFINSLYKSLIEPVNNDLKTKKYINIHDRYSLPFSSHAKKYGNLVTDFFSKAPSEVEDYVIEEYEANKDIVLSYDVKSEGKKYQRIIKIDGSIEDSTT
jgi:hypothetical protein